MGFKVGGDTPAWCKPCGLLLAHVVVSVDPAKGRPHRVECKTCGAVHAYRAAAPGAQTAGEAKTKAGGARAHNAAAAAPRRGAFVKAMEGRDPSTARAYTLADASAAEFAKDDLLEHAQFGLGVVTDIVDSRMMLVLFEDRDRRLLRAR